VDTRIVAAFSEAASRAFGEMFGLEAKAEGARELDSSAEHGWDITGLIGLAGQAQGIVAVRLSQAMVARLLAGSGVETGDAAEKRQLEGGLVGEMTNIIAGSAISAIEDINIEIAPPVIVRGQNHKIGWPSIAPVIALPFASKDVSFEVDLCIKH
jgi:chemotaxis protein CheX